VDEVEKARPSIRLPLPPCSPAPDCESGATPIDSSLLPSTRGLKTPRGLRPMRARQKGEIYPIEGVRWSLLYRL